ncbi:MAG: hypothetical protein ACLU7P_10560, partial [Eggerthella lenta]
MGGACRVFRLHREDGSRLCDRARLRTRCRADGGLGMFSKRLAGMVPEARKYVAASVALQWVALAANIALMLLMGAFVQSLVEGGDVAA